jgi:hypothetical protein
MTGIHTYLEEIIAAGATSFSPNQAQQKRQPHRVIYEDRKDD